MYLNQLIGFLDGSTLSRSKSPINKLTTQINKANSIKDVMKIKKSNAQAIEPIPIIKKKSIAISDFSSNNVTDKGASRTTSPIQSTNSRKTESSQTRFTRSNIPVGNSRTPSKSPSGVQIVVVNKTLRKGVDNLSIKKGTKQANRDLNKFTTEASLNSKSLLGKTLQSISHSYLDDDDLITYVNNEKALANNTKKQNKSSNKLQTNNKVNIATKPKNFISIYEIDMRSISTIRTRNDLDDDFDLINQTVDEKVTRIIYSG